MPTRERRLAELAREHFAELEKEQTQLGAEVALVPLYVSPAVTEALTELSVALRTTPRLYHDCVLALRRLQRTNDGPLTDVLAAWVGDV